MAIKQEILDKLAANSPDVVGLSLTTEVESDEDVELLVKALENNTHLKVLTIQGQIKKIEGRYTAIGMTDKGAILLSKCPHLTFLNISFNKNITPRCVEALAQHPSLQTLFMRGCSITNSLELAPFLKNNIIVDLRIAHTPSEDVGDAIREKLKENALRDPRREEMDRLEELRKEIQFREVEDVNYVLMEELQENLRENPGVIEKLPVPVQAIAHKDYKTWEEPLIMGQTLAFNLSTLDTEETRRIAKIAEVFVERYRALREVAKADVEVEAQRKAREEAQKLMQFPPAPASTQNKKAKPNHEPPQEDYATKVFRYLERKKK